jgi:hypothetical protein
MADRYEQFVNHKIDVALALVQGDFEFEGGRESA